MQMAVPARRFDSGGSGRFRIRDEKYPQMDPRVRELRMLANVFSNTTTTRVEKAEGVPLLTAIAAPAFVACAAL